MTELVNYELADDIAVITMDDGKANAFAPAMSAAVNDSLDQAQGEAKAVVLTGRPGLLSGGFDLKIIRGDDPQAARAMSLAGARLMMRLYGLPLPFVIAAPGHAVALGAFCLLTADYRVGVSGDFRIGLNETAIGMSLPPFGLMLATERLSKRYVARATIGATMFTPSEARDAGFLDEVVDVENLRDVALAKAKELAVLDGSSYAAVKKSLRGDAIDAVLAGLEG